MRAIAANDAAAFDKVLARHVGFLCRNAARSFVLAASGSRLAQVPGEGPVARYCRHLTRMSAAFALTTDAALATLGGALKRREKISGRFADALAWMYLASASIKRFHADGMPEEDRPLLEWCCDLALWNIQEALRGVLDNLPNRPVAWLLRALIFPLGARFRPPRDELGASLARALLDDGAMRRRLTRNIFVAGADEPGLGQIEAALAAVVRARAARQKLNEAARGGRLTPEPSATLIERALASGIIDAEEAARSRAAADAQDAAIQVDAFATAEYLRL
jgi:acyl-CoA dehydrogenase